MPWTLNASACPAIVTYSGVHDPATDGAIIAPSLVAGDTTALLTKFNEVAARVDLVGRYGGGGYAIGEGLAISAGSGLTLNISEGWTTIESGEYYLGGSVTLTNNIARVWLWISQAGAIVQVNNSTTPPAGAHALLGSAVTSGGSITSVDQSGVLYLVGGTLFRRTADTSLPGDTPSSKLQFIHRGASKLWWWDGSQYWQIAAGTSSWTQATISITGNQTLTAAEVAANTLYLTDGGVSAGFTLTFPTTAAAGQVWAVTNFTGEVCRLTYTGGTQYVYLGGGSTTDPISCMVFLSNGELRRVDAPVFLDGPDWTGTGTLTWSQFEETAGDYLSLVPSGDTAFNIATAGALNNRGKSIIAENTNTGTAIVNIRTSGATGDKANTYLLPGEVTLGAIDGAGTWRRIPTRGGYTRRVAITIGDAHTTVSHPDFLAERIEVSSSVPLTASRNLVLPTCDCKEWWVANITSGGQTLVAKTSGGSGVTIANGSVCRVAGDGTNIRRLTPDATY